MIHKNKKILIIEDERDLAKTLKHVLDARGYETEVCYDGEEGFDQTLEFRPDLILLDLLLPKIFGLDILEKIRKNRDKKIANTPVLIITNYPESEYLKKADKLGVRGFLIKADYDVTQLADKINIILSK